MGTTTQYGYIGPSTERNPYFYSALITKVADGPITTLTNIAGERIEVSGTDPNGNPIPGNRFNSLSVMASPDGSDTVQQILSTIATILINNIPYGLSDAVKCTISAGVATTDQSPQMAWAEWDHGIFDYPTERGIDFGFGLVVDPGLEGTYTINIHYETSIQLFTFLTDGWYQHMDTYDTITYQYVNTPDQPSQPLGPTSGIKNNVYGYSTSAHDPNLDNLKYTFYWGDGSTYTTGWYPSDVAASAYHFWSSNGWYYVNVVAMDSTGAYSIPSPFLPVLIDNPPLTPSTPSGASSCQTGNAYSYSTSTTDPDGDNVGYNWDFGDGSGGFTSVSYQSGAVMSVTQYWSSPGTYNVRVKAQDIYGGWSGWSTSLQVTVTGDPVGGGCPYVYAWNGSGYAEDNNILPASEKRNSTDTRDYCLLQQLLVPVFSTQRRSLYSLQIREFENEQDYIDQVKLIAVDHTQGTSVAVTPEGEILTYRNPQPPLGALDENGRDWLQAISSKDSNYYQSTVGDYFTLYFGNVSTSNAKLILREDPPGGPPMKTSVHVQMLTINGSWMEIADIPGRVNWATDILDVSPYLQTAYNPLTVRLYFTAVHRVDYVGLDTSPPVQVNITSASPILASHSTLGDVRTKLLYDDEQCVKLVNGQQITMTFTLANNAQGTTRDFIFYADGHYYTITS